MDYKEFKAELQEALEVEAYVDALEAARLYDDHKEIIAYTLERLYNKGDYNVSGLWHQIAIVKGLRSEQYVEIIKSSETRDVIFRAISEVLQGKEDGSLDSVA